MEPDARAYADKLIYDVAMVRYMATSLPKGGLERTVPGGWTVRQLLGHMGDAQSRYVAAISRALAGEKPFGDGFDPEQQNAAAAPGFAKAKLPALLAALVETRDAILGLLEPASQDQLDAPFSHGLTLVGALRRWSGHLEGHALDFIDAAPELRVDPMVLNWLLYADFSAVPAWQERQQKLFEEVREMLEDGEPGADEDEFEDEEDD